MKAGIFSSSVNALIGLLRSWWLVDRVRVAPREGRLLRLRPPCLIQVRSQTVEVLRRQVGQTANGPYVVYYCHNGLSPCQLWVRLVGSRQGSKVRWVEGSDELELAVDEIQVYG